MTFIPRIFLARSDGEVYEKGKGTRHDTYIEIGIHLIQCISRHNSESRGYKHKP